MKTLKALTVCCLCLLVIAVAGPASGKTKEFNFPALNKIEIPKPDKEVLENGMVLYLLEDHTLPRVNLSVTINRCGSYLEPPHLIGLADMTGEVMRTGGTATMTGDEIDEELEAIGAYVETGIGSVSGSASANSLSEYAETIVSIMADVMRNPVFDEDKIELARTSAKSGISRRNDDPMQITIREFRKLMYGPDSPYARHTEYATIDAVTRDDMVNFHKMLVQPNNIQMAIWGDFDKANMIGLIKRYFGDWAKGEMEIPPPPDVDYNFTPTVNYAEKTDVNQSNILIGHIGGKMGDPDYPKTIVMNSILGGSFGSRITDNVRSKKGLAYAAQARYSFNYEYPGWFYAYAATKSESTAEAIKEIIKQIKSMQTDPATPEEMRKAKDGWLNAFVFNFDSKGKILNRMMTYDYHGMPEDYLQQLKEGVEQVTPEDVIEVSQRKLNPENLQIIVTGKGEDFDEPLSIFGEVNEIDLTIPSPESEEFEATEEELAKGKEMLMLAANACGGVGNFKLVTTVKTHAKMTLNMPQGAMTLDVTNIEVLPDKTAQIMKMPMGEQKEVFDGEAGWVMAAEQVQPMSADDVAEQKKNQSRSMITIFAKADAPDFKVAYKGEADFAGKRVARLDFLTAEGAQLTMYLNPDDNMPAGTRHMGKTMMGPGEIVATYGEFVKYGDILQPSTIKMDMGGMVIDVEVVSIEINGEIDMTVFDRPEGI